MRRFSGAIGSLCSNSPFLLGEATRGGAVLAMRGGMRGTLYQNWFGSENLTYTDHRGDNTILRGTLGESNSPSSLSIKEMNHPSLTFCDSHANPPKGDACPKPALLRELGEPCSPHPDARGSPGAMPQDPQGQRPWREASFHPGCLRRQCTIITWGAQEIPAKQRPDPTREMDITSGSWVSAGREPT